MPSSSHQVSLFKISLPDATIIQYIQDRIPFIPRGGNIRTSSWISLAAILFIIVAILTSPFEIDGVRVSDIVSGKKPDGPPKRVLRFRAMFNEYQVDYFESVAQRFEKSHADVDVVIERVSGGSWTDFEVTLLNDFWSGNAPDVARISEITITRLLKVELLDEAPADIVEGLDALLVSDDLKKMLHRGDKTYGTIHAATWQGLYYNRDHFREVGLDPDKPPQTWEELVEYAGKLTVIEKGKVTRAGLSLRKGGYAPGTAMKFYDFFFSAGGRLYDEEKRHSLINSESGVRALTLYTDILYKYGYDGFEVEGDDVGFLNGTVSMFARGGWVIKKLHDNAPNIDWGITHIPAGTQSASNGAIYPLVVAKDSPLKDLAWEFVRLLMSPEVIAEYNTNEMTVPFVPEAYALPQFQNNEAYTSFLTQPNVIPITVIPRMNEIETMIGTTIENVAWNNLDPKTELDILAAKIDLLLQEPPPATGGGPGPEPFAWGLIIASALAFGIYIFLGRRESGFSINPYLYLAPFILYFTIFFIYPIVSSLTLSFWDYNPLEKTHPFVGFGNYEKALADKIFLKSIWNTISYAFWTVSIGVILSLALALVLNRALAGVGIYRALYFIPVVTSIMGATLVWKFMYGSSGLGMFNMILNTFNIDGLLWLKDEKLAMPCLIMFAVWKSLGFNMIIFLTGLKAIPGIYEEAAKVDGAGRWQRFVHITLPCLKPTTLFVVVTSLIVSFQVFTQIIGMTEGGPNNATRTIVYHIYEVGFRDFRLGYASAAAVIMLLMVGFITYFQMRLMRE